MLVTLVAVLCQLQGPVCTDEVITDSKMDDTLTLMTCQLAQPGIAKWLVEHPSYHTGWRLDGYKCVVGPYTPPRSA